MFYEPLLYHATQTRLNLSFVSIFLRKYHWVLEIYIYVLYKYKLKVLEVIYNICVCIASCLYTRYRTHTTHFVNNTYNIVFLIYIYIYICLNYIQPCWISSTYVACTNQYPSNQYSLCYLSPDSSMVRVYHQRSESCGFDSRLGLRNVLIGLK